MDQKTTAIQRREKKPELLMPAGSLPVLRTVLLYGADAVYIGGEEYGLRAGAKNFSYDDMRQAVSLAHSLHKKIYVTVNIIAHDGDLPGVREYLDELACIGPDALIISDPGIFSLARTCAPDIPIHISTQASSCNYETYNFWNALGASRVVSARELSISEIRDVRAHIPESLEIETFVHGAMCISYSGRCLLSNYFTGRDANQGACTHPCRWQYDLRLAKAGEPEDQSIPADQFRAYIEEGQRPGEYLPVQENDRGTYIFNSKDLCMVEHIPELVDAGIDSFKVEGRMKTALYGATVARAYRKALDDYYDSPDKYREHLPWYSEEVRKCTYRQYTTGFFFGKPDHSSQVYDSNQYVKNYTYLGTIETCGKGESAEICDIILTQKNKFSVGEDLEIMIPSGRDITARVTSIRDDQGRHQDSAPHPAQSVTVTLQGAPDSRITDFTRPGLVIRKKNA